LPLELGGHLAAWLRSGGPELLAQRAASEKHLWLQRQIGELVLVQQSFERCLS
jgi:hypothetical protein